MVVLRRWARSGWELSDPEYTAAREAATLRLLEGAGLQVPRLLGVDELGSECDVPAVLQTLVAGSPPNPPPLAIDDFVQQLAKAIVPVHRVDRRAAEEVVTEYRRYQTVEDLEPPTWATRVALWKDAIEVDRTPEPPVRKCLIHRDYHQGNTLWDRGELTAVVDWDKASLGSPALDVAHMRVNLVLELGAGAAGAFTAAYRRLSGEPLADLPYWDVADTLDLAPALVFDSGGMVAKVLRLEAHLESALEEWGR